MTSFWLLFGNRRRTKGSCKARAAAGRAFHVCCGLAKQRRPSRGVVLWDGHEVLAGDGILGVNDVLDHAGQLVLDELPQVGCRPFAKWLAQADLWADDTPADLQRKRDARVRVLN